MHLLTIAITLGLAFFIPLAFRGRREDTRYIAGVSIAVVIVYHMMRQTIDTPSGILGNRPCRYTCVICLQLRLRSTLFRVSAFIL